jgi:ABC-2 type transport system permease protein
LRVVSQRRPIGTHLVEIWRYRELLGNLIQKELKVRYKNSALGFVWSMLQPVFLLVIYGLAFSILGAGFDQFAIWLLCGLVVWTFVSTACTTATQAVTSNSYLVTKVRFPRVVLPLASVGAALVHLMLQMVAFGVVLVLLRHGVAWEYVWLLPIATVTMTMVCAGIGMLLAATNVYARDTQHLFDMLVLAWFWLTPILYQYQRAAVYFTAHGFPSGTLLINPATSVVITFQRAIYAKSSVNGLALLPDGSPFWYLRNLLIVLAVAVAIFLFALRIFDRAEANFAEVI